MASTSAQSVEFPDFRRYEATRQEANNAMMALLAGSKLAAHTLQLTSGSRQLLPDIFPGVDHINYFRLRTDRATELLQDTGHHLGAVALPYALAVHEDFVGAVIELLRERGFTIKAPGKKSDLTKNPVQAWNMHEAVYLTLGQACPTGVVEKRDIQLFHFLREMRNTHIHAGGVVNQRLKDSVAAMSPEAAAEWVRLARQEPVDALGATHLRFTTFDIFAAFAVTKSLGRQINSLLRNELGRSHWARIAVDDYAAQTSKVPRSDSWMRGLIGYAGMNYGTVRLTDQELADSAIIAGYWINGRALGPRRSEGSTKSRRNRGTAYPGK